MTELENLIDARKKIDARIQELKNAENFKYYGSVRLTKGENGRNSYWKNVYRLKIKKYSTMIESESGRYKTIIENPDLDKLYLYLKVVIRDLNKCLKDIELAMEAKKNEDIK